MQEQPPKPYYGLPHEVKYCKRCVISNQRPSSTVEFKNKDNSKKRYIEFEDGVCSACLYHEIKEAEIDWKQREEYLFELLEPYRRGDGSYDVIVPSSGGKDSSFAAHVLKYKYGMNPLTVTWSPHMYTDVGWSNMRNLAETGGIDNILYTPNGQLHRLLTKLAFLNLGHPFQPFIHGQKIIGPAMARRFGITMIMYGENQAEYGNPFSDNRSPLMSPDFFTIDNPMEMVMGGVTLKEIMDQYGFTLHDFTPYLPLASEEIKAHDINVTYLGYFERWDPQECYYYAAENTGFQASPERSPGTYSKYTEIDDKMIPFHFYTMLTKFGMGRATYDAAQEIRNRKITREEGVLLVKKYDLEFPQVYFKDFLDYVDITEDQFFKTIHHFRSPHLWRRENGEWKLAHPVWEEGN